MDVQIYLPTLNILKKSCGIEFFFLILAMTGLNLVPILKFNKDFKDVFGLGEKRGENMVGCWFFLYLVGLKRGGKREDQVFANWVQYKSA